MGLTEKLLSVIIVQKQQQASRPRKLPKRAHLVRDIISSQGRRKKIIKITIPLLYQPLQSSTLPVEATTHEMFVDSFMKCICMARQLHTSLRLLCTMPSLSWSGARHAATWVRSSENVFSAAMNHALLAGSLMNESGFGRCQNSI